MALIAADREKALYEALSKGKESGRKAFFNVFKAYLASVCRRYIDSEEDVSDVLQDVFVKVFTRIGSFSWRGPGSLQAWAKKIAVNEALVFLKKKARYPVLPIEALPDGEAAEEDADVAQGVPAAALMEMIRQLSPQYRAVFNMYVLDDMGHKDIAAQLGISEVTSASNLSRAKKILAKMIKDYKSSIQ